MKFDYLVCTTYGHQWATTDKCVHSYIHLLWFRHIPSNQVVCLEILSVRTWGYIAFPYPQYQIMFHSSDWIRIHQWMVLDSSHVMYYTNVQQHKFFGLHDALRSKECIPLVYVYRGHPDEDFCRLYSFTAINCCQNIFSIVALYDLFRSIAIIL